MKMVAQANRGQVGAVRELTLIYLLSNTPVYVYNLII